MGGPGCGQGSGGRAGEQGEGAPPRVIPCGPGCAPALGPACWGYCSDCGHVCPVAAGAQRGQWGEAGYLPSGSFFFLNKIYIF